MILVSGLWRLGLAMTLQLGDVLIFPLELVMVRSVSPWMGGRSPHVSDIGSGSRCIVGWPWRPRRHGRGRHGKTTPR